jgi:hypothetical protein
LKSGFKHQAIKLLFIAFFVMVFVFGCTTRSASPDTNTSAGKRDYERIVYGENGSPILKIVCKYVGKKPVAGFKTDIDWETINTDFYKLYFINLTNESIEFISSKSYQSLPGKIAEQRNTLSRSKQSPVLIEHKDYRKEYDPNFDPLVYREQRTLINWPIHTYNKHPYA